MSSQTTPPNLIDSSTSTPPALTHEEKTTYHLNVDEWTWTRHALRPIRCASFARSSNSSTGSVLKRNKTDARRAIHETRKRPERLLEIQFKLRKRLRTASDATCEHACEDRGHVTVDMTLCGGNGGSQPSPHAPTNQPQMADQISLGQIASQI